MSLCRERVGVGAKVVDTLEDSSLPHLLSKSLFCDSPSPTDNYCPSMMDLNRGGFPLCY